MSDHKVKVAIKGLSYVPRGKAGEYRAGSVQILDALEAYELDEAGIATIMEDPCVETPVDPYAFAPVEAAPVAEEKPAEEVVASDEEVSEDSKEDLSEEEGE